MGQERQCMCVRVCLGAAADRWRLLEAGGVLTPLYRRVPLFSPCLHFTPCAHTHTHTQSHTFPASAWLHRPLPPAPPGQRHQDTNTHTSNLWHASRRALQSQKKWSRWDKDGSVSSMLQTATGDPKVTQPITVYTYSSPSCQPHSSTLALSTCLLDVVEKVVKLTRSGKINVCYSQI